MKLIEIAKKIRKEDISSYGYLSMEALEMAIAEAELMEDKAKAFDGLVSKGATTFWEEDYCLKITLENVKAAMKES